MDSQIKIITGRVHSGKTTKLFTFINSQESINGILAPVINNKRMLYHISSKELRVLEVQEQSHLTISIGDYNFLLDTFNWANQKLIDGFSKNPEWLIVDEIGKLELDKKGLFDSAEFILKNVNNTNTKIILVIRDYLVKSVLEFFNLHENEIENLEI